MKRFKGISLVETTLVIAVGAVIAMTAVHFYWRTKSRSALLQATLQIQRIVSASNQWETAERVADLSSQGSNLLNTLIQDKLLTQDDDTNPWGGVVSAAGNDSGELIVRLDGVPSDACTLLVSHFKTKSTEGNFSCYGKDSDDTWEGHF